MTTASQWVAGARPRTLPLALCPVLVGTTTATLGSHVSWWKATVAAAVALLLQIGVNYANDYSDGVRGTDRDRRGPLRLTASGLASPGAVRTAALSCLALAAVAGVVLAIAVDLWLLAVGVACIAGAWLYSGGKHPYGYAGYGELAVLVFFGFVATVGSAYIQRRSFPAAAWWGALAVGLPACAVLVANNLRDIESDLAVGKRTLAVRLGGSTTTGLFVGLVAGGFLATVPIGVEHPGAFLTLAALPFAVEPMVSVSSAADPASLVRALVRTVRLAIAIAILLSVGLVIH
jgi:1,4-dihydroxy-2-naphthoate polyprenyltransferase